MSRPGRPVSGLLPDWLSDRLSGRLGGPNLRRRIAVAVGLFTTVAVVAFGTAVWLMVADSLMDSVDDDLRATAELIQTVGLDNQVGDGEVFEGEPPGAFGVDDWTGLVPDGGRPPIPYVQLLDPLGEIRGGAAWSGELPTSEGARGVARGEATEHTELIELDGRTVRLLTVDVDVDRLEGAIQIGSDVTSITEGLRRARAGSLLAGLLAGLGAAAMAWLFSRRLIAPVRAVAEAADHLRAERELPDRLVGEGPDELGHLVTSFNALLDDVSDSRTRQRRLVADASHELRTPLTSLRLKIEFIQSQPGLAADERGRLIAGAVADLDSLGDLVSELVELAAEGATEERPVLTDLGRLVEAESARFAATSGRQVEVATVDGMVETRPKQVTRALTNLLVNADKYSPDDGVIAVSQTGPRIEVRDHGPGIPSEERERVFDRFYRGRAHQSIEGSGLGLAIVESMARANGGRTWIADPDDGGPGTVVGFTAGPSES